ncbi:dephospho-CoA kinase [Fructilactobacillus frigidiflavus]|uniref:dephospho-CoA kinase n=1 Tax=Fructilactobacillus frigidiflavus TaxID=3242688 RepID=UPI003757E16A
MTRIIGLTGGIASGKSTVGEILRTQGFKVIDLDQTVHCLENENEVVIQRISNIFGEHVIDAGKVNRPKLAKIVFNDELALKKLVRILNPFLIAEIRQSSYDDLVFIEAPTLFENGLQIYVDKVVMITCDPIVQMQRLIKRNQLSISKASLLINSQWPQAIKKDLSDFSIDASTGIDDLKKQVQGLIDNLR